MEEKTLNGYLTVMRIFVLVLCARIFIHLVASPVKIDSCSQNDLTKYKEWELARMVESPPHGCTIIGRPQIIDCPYGKAVQFDGEGDAIVLDTNLLVNMRQFTIELIMRPDTNGQREQRFLHFGEVRGERVMVETRLTKDSQWFLDTYMKSGQTGQTLADSTKLHPLNRWYHIAFIVDEGKMEAFINGKRELEGQIPFSPFTIGQTSLGVRLNRVNWYKGAMYKIRITPHKVKLDAFMNTLVPERKS